MDEHGQPVAESNGQARTSPPSSPRQSQRSSLRVWRVVALLLAAVGLFLIWLIVIHRNIPLIKISAIQATMNGALVRVAGKATGDAHAFRETGKVHSVRFTVNDGTGDLAVMAYGKQAEQMALFDRIPHAGDTVEITGSLSSGANNNISLRLQSGDGLKLQRAEKMIPPLARVTNVEAGTQVVISGAVTRVVAPRSGSHAPYVVTVCAAPAERQFVIWPNVFDGLAAHDHLVLGATIRAKVTAERFKDEIQFKLSRAVDLEVLPAPAAPLATNAVLKTATP